MHALHLARQTRIPYPTNHIAHPFPLVEVDPISFMHVYVLRTGSFCIPRVSLRELISFFEVLISPLPLRFGFPSQSASVFKVTAPFPKTIYLELLIPRLETPNFEVLNPSFRRPFVSEILIYPRDTFPLKSRFPS